MIDYVKNFSFGNDEKKSEDKKNQISDNKKIHQKKNKSVKTSHYLKGKTSDNMNKNNTHNFNKNDNHNYQKNKGDKLDQNFKTKYITFQKLNDLYKEQLKNKNSLIEQYRKKCEEQNKLIKDLECILKELKNDNNPKTKNKDLKINEDYDDFDEEILNNEGMQEEFALKAVEQQIIDELCPNPDSMSYEQLLELENKVGKVNKGLNKKQFDDIKLIKYNKYVNKENYQCIICMEEFQENEIVKLLPCKHIFHSNCIKQWLMKEKTCPFCKKEII